MALIGKLDQIRKQVIDYPGFSEAFDYLALILEEGSEENKRLLTHPTDSFVKVSLNDAVFALEQVYVSKEREACFFESHRQYIDVQFILEGEERIDISSTAMLTVDMLYDKEKDLMKYHDTKEMTSLLLQKGDVAIFFPEDAHMPCLKIDKTTLVYKTVVKVPVFK